MPMRHPGGAQEAGLSMYAQERDVSRKSESGDEPAPDSLQSISTHLLFSYGHKPIRRSLGFWRFASGLLVNPLAAGSWGGVGC